MGLVRQLYSMGTASQILCQGKSKYAMRAYRGVDVNIKVFLTLALVGGEW
jgi:hypothetical protein